MYNAHCMVKPNFFYFEFLAKESFCSMKIDALQIGFKKIYLWDRFIVFNAENNDYFPFNVDFYCLIREFNSTIIMSKKLRAIELFSLLRQIFALPPHGGFLIISKEFQKIFSHCVLNVQSRIKNHIRCHAKILKTNSFLKNIFSTRYSLHKYI